MDLDVKARAKLREELRSLERKLDSISYLLQHALHARHLRRGQRAERPAPAPMPAVSAVETQVGNPPALVSAAFSSGRLQRKRLGRRQKKNAKDFEKAFAISSQEVENQEDFEVVDISPTKEPFLDGIKIT